MALLDVTGRLARTFTVSRACKRSIYHGIDMPTNVHAATGVVHLLDITPDADVMNSTAKPVFLFKGGASNQAPAAAVFGAPEDQVWRLEENP